VFCRSRDASNRYNVPVGVLFLVSSQFGLSVLPMMTPQVRDRFRAIRNKVEQGGRLDLEDGVFLYSPEVGLHEVGELAKEDQR
jgi:hypothetical protein